MNIAPARPGTRDVSTDNDVGLIVRRFYRAAIPDDLLGPVFVRFGVDWSRHIPKLVQYWEHVLLGRPGSGVNTIGAHGPVHHVAPFGEAHIARWIELWDDAVDELYAGPVAEQAKARAHQVGRALRSRVMRRREGATT